MAFFCNHCGTLLTDGAAFCPNCGARASIPQAASNPGQPVTPVQPARPRNPRRKSPVLAAAIVVPVVVIIAVAALFLWKPIAMRLSPQSTLASASQKTFSDISDRLDDSPFGALKTAVDYVKDGTVDLEFSYDDPYDGPIDMSASISSDLEARRQSSDFEFSMYGQTADFSYYLDADCFAVASDLATEGTYYGITYDTFSSDLRKSFLYDMLYDEQIDMLEEMVDTINSALNENQEPDPEVLEPYVEIIEEYVSGLKFEVGSDTIRLDGKDRKCSTITTEVDMEALFDMLAEVAKTARKDDTFTDIFDQVADVSGEDLQSEWEDAMYAYQDLFEMVADSVSGAPTLTYYIYKDRIVCFRLEGEIEVDDGYDTESVDVLFTTSLGADPATSDWAMELEITVDRETLSAECTYSSSNTNSSYTDELEFSLSIPDEGTASLALESSWNKSSGDVEFAFNVNNGYQKISASLEANLLVAKDGVTFSIDNLQKAISLPYDTSYIPDISFSVSFHEGEPVKKPDYVNLDKWDEDTFEEIGERLEDNF